MYVSLYGFFSPNLKNTWYSFPHVHAISPLNAQLIHWLSHREIFPISVLHSSRIFSNSSHWFCWNCICAAWSLFCRLCSFSLLILASSFEYCIEKRRTLYLIQSQATLISENSFPSSFHTSFVYFALSVEGSLGISSDVLLAIFSFKICHFFGASWVVRKGRNSKFCKKVRSWSIYQIASQRIKEHLLVSNNGFLPEFIMFSLLGKLSKIYPKMTAESPLRGAKPRCLPQR